MSDNSHRTKPISIKEIAKLAKVSQSTVSKALNNRHDVNEDTRQRILDIVQKYNYLPNIFGKALKSQLTESIGVLICKESQPLSSNPFYSRVLEGIEAELALKNYSLTLHMVNGEVPVRLPKIVRERRVDGLILVGAFDPDFTDSILASDIPTSFIDPKFSVEAHDQVLIDNEHGAFMATQHLISSGHKKIGFVSGSLNRMSFKQRYNGFSKAMEFYNLKINDDWVETGGLEEGYTQITRIFKKANRPTALFAANDINAIRGYKALNNLGLRIPEDVSVVGFDDIEFAKHSHPSLTTIRVYKEELGSLAIRSLFKRINGETTRPATTVVPVKLIKRDSVAQLDK